MAHGNSSRVTNAALSRVPGAPACPLSKQGGQITSDCLAALPPVRFCLWPLFVFLAGGCPGAKGYLTQTNPTGPPLPFAEPLHACWISAGAKAGMRYTVGTIPSPGVFGLSKIRKGLPVFPLPPVVVAPSLRKQPPPPGLQTQLRICGR
uniref:Uncharacterized protein n=1 Tax=Sphaerodactylus townsendi TaxID=933632 RepID=A0ACB8F1N4_9SAUR